MRATSPPWRRRPTWALRRRCRSAASPSRLRCRSRAAASIPGRRMTGTPKPRATATAATVVAATPARVAARAAARVTATPTQTANPVKAATAGTAAAASRRVPGTAMERKVVNDAVAYIRGLAELRGRNAEWAEQAVRGAASLSATAALQQRVIDVIARDLPDLLARIDGREVKINDRAVKIESRDLAVVHMKPDWRTNLLAMI